MHDEWERGRPWLVMGSSSMAGTPLVQLLHAVVPLVLLNFPASHSAHTPVPACGAWLPGRHWMQALALALPGMGLPLPGGHAMQELLFEAPRVGLYDPAGQGSKVCRTLKAPVLAQ